MLELAGSLILEEIAIGVHDAYAKKVLRRATSKQFQHWFVEEDVTVNCGPGGLIGKLDGVIGKDCVVEVEGLNEKQIRGGIGILDKDAQLSKEDFIKIVENK